MRKLICILLFAGLFSVLEIKAQNVVIQINKPFISKNLSGIITDHRGNILSKVTVERCSIDWKDRLESTSTNEKGEFIFLFLPSGTHYLRIRYNGFQELKIKIQIDRKAKKQPVIRMELAI